MRAIALALRHRELRLLLSAGLVSLTGDWVLRIGLAYYVYALTGSTLASATMLLASFVPQVVLSSLAGVFVDRWDLRRTMVTANVLLALGLLPLVTVHRPGQMWIVYLVTVWEGCVQQFFAPAQQSLIEGFKTKIGLLQDTVALINEMRKGNEAGAARIASGLKQKGT